MKKVLIFVLSALLCVLMVGCGNDDDLGKQTTIDKVNGYTLVQEVLTFKFSEVEDDLTQEKGAVVSGFKYSEETPYGAVNSKADALEIAKGDAAVEYNKINVAFDRTRGVWRVIFSNDTEITDADGNKKTENKVAETIYVDEDGYSIAAVIEK